MPVVGFLRSTSLAPFQSLVVAFGEGLKEAGFVAGQNVAIEYRYAENQKDRLPDAGGGIDLASPVAVLVGEQRCGGRGQGGNDDGADRLRGRRRSGQGRPRRQPQPARWQHHWRASWLSAQVGAKRLELLRQIVPKTTTIGMLEDLNSPGTEAERTDVQAAAQAIGLQLIIIDVNNDRDIETAIASFVNAGPARCWSAPAHS